MTITPHSCVGCEHFASAFLLLLLLIVIACGSLLWQDSGALQSIAAFAAAFGSNASILHYSQATPMLGADLPFVPRPQHIHANGNDPSLMPPSSKPLFITCEFPPHKSNLQYFEEYLVNHGGKHVMVDVRPFFAQGPNCCGIQSCGGGTGKRRSAILDCPRHFDWVKSNIFDKYSNFTHIFMTGKGCIKMAATALLLPGRVLPVIVQEYRQPICMSQIPEAALQRASVIMVFSKRTTTLCPSVNEKMVIGGERVQTGHHSDVKSLHKSIGERWREQGRSKYIVSVGSSHRDHNLLLSVVHELKLDVTVKLFSKRNRYALCTKAFRCEYAFSHTSEGYSKSLAGALFIAIPLDPAALFTGAGITGLIESLRLGKITIISESTGDGTTGNTEHPSHLSDTFIHNGTSGFRVRIGDKEAWKRTISHITSSPDSVLQQMEHNVATIAEEYTAEALGEKVMKKMSVPLP